MKQRRSSDRCQTISSYSSQLPDALSSVAPLVIFQFVAQWTVSPLGHTSNAQEPSDGEVPIIRQGRRLHPDTHVVAGATTRTGKGRRINGPRRIEHLNEIRGEIIDHTPAKTTANNDDLGIIGGVLQRSNWLRGVSVELAILLWHGGQNRNN
jgi:hypothetical protein